MKSIVAVAGAGILTLLAGAAHAQSRCDLNGQQGADVLVRYPLPHPTPQSPNKHVDKHIVWMVDRVPAERDPGELGWENPAVIAVGDFIPGGGCDLLWQSQPELESETAKLAVSEGLTQVDDIVLAFGPERPPLPWEVVGAFDLTGDGFADILWWNTSTGTASLWVTGPNGWSPHEVGGVSPQLGRPVAIALSASQNGQPGIIWYNPPANAPYTWTPVAFTGQQLLVQSVASITGLQSGWNIVAAGDFNHDGREDLLRQRAEGINDLQVCLMNGLAVMGCQPLDPTGLGMTEHPDLKWYVVGPR